MELNLFSFIIFSLTTLTIMTKVVYTSAVNYDKEVRKTDLTVKMIITEVKEPNLEEQEVQNKVKIPTHEGIVTSDRKDTDESLGDVVKQTLCSPSPCGPNSQCREVGAQAICSCQNNFIGTPPNCALECTNNSECASGKACLNRECVDPCVNQCARNANCIVIAHKPICTCQDRFTGDAFTSCVPIPMPLSIPTLLPEVDPCLPSPCRMSFWHWCEVFNGTARCACLQDYFRAPPRCIPECTVDSDCNADMRCKYSRCIDPCSGYCGHFATCDVIDHRPHCSCLPGLTGDPRRSCYVFKPTPCRPSPCGPYSHCREVVFPLAQAVCRCQKPFMGIPPNCGGCTDNSECASGKACRNHKCVVEPCVNQCAGNANCRAIAHNDVPLPLSNSTQRSEVDPCTPSPCGPHSQCQEYNGNACCSCLPYHIGSPPTCRPECTINSECDQHLACINNRCSDPCLGACGKDAECDVIEHLPYCTCEICYFGDPFISCYDIYEKPTETSGGFLERKKENGWTFDFPTRCGGYGLTYTEAVIADYCPKGSVRFKKICVETDE